MTKKKKTEPEQKKTHQPFRIYKRSLSLKIEKEIKFFSVKTNCMQNVSIAFAFEIG